MASLTPLTEVLGYRRAKHLLRRASFTYTKDQIDIFASKTPLEAVNLLFSSTTNFLEYGPYDPRDTDNGFWTALSIPYANISGDVRKRTQVCGWWWYNAIKETSLKHKLTFFLHTCFTVGKDSNSGKSTHFYDHLCLLEYYSYGNIKELAKKITLDNSMLIYLDNTSNNANNPNENYAREFLELFTILKGPQIGDGNYTNYTEIDVQNAAKVFSGYKRNLERSLIIDPETNIPTGYLNIAKHDASDKEFSSAFNQTITGGVDEAGALQELDDFVEMVFGQQATSISYCRKLYRFFVKSEISSEVENDIITPLAQLMVAENYEMIPVITKLLTSQHFYDKDDSDDTDNIIGAIVKSPLQLFSEVVTLFNLEMPEPPNPTNPNNPFDNPGDPIANPDGADQFYVTFFQRFVHNSFLNGAGFDFFNPDSVAGYPAMYQEPDYDRHWFRSNTLIARYKMIESLIAGKNTITSGTIFATLDTISFVENNISDPSDSILLVIELSDLLYPESISTERVNYFVNSLIDGYNEYYWTSEWGKYENTGDTSVIKTRLDDLVISMINAAEFQLM